MTAISLASSSDVLLNMSMKFWIEKLLEKLLALLLQMGQVMA